MDISSIPRAALSAAAGMVYSVERAMVRQPVTARTNAWQAIQADRRRARQRAEVNRMVALASSPRERAGAAPAGAADR